MIKNLTQEVMSIIHRLMATISTIFTVVTALLHGYFFILEMFLWSKPFGLKTFRMTQAVAQSSRVLAANQGLYNGLLALGLLLSFIIPDPASALAVRRYCLGFIVIAGAYGAYSLNNSQVLWIQSLPALIALLASLN